MTLSVIIPVLDEADALPRLLTRLRAQRGLELEFIVADGGSRDGSPELARQHGARVLRTAPGRATQLNAGVALARHDHLLFLHADSDLTEPGTLVRALEDWRKRLPGRDNAVAGHFRLVFDRRGGANRAGYRYLEAKSASNRPQTINGDQGLLIHKNFFQRLGGFDESLPFMEDQEIAQRIFDVGEWMLLPGTLHTSARRFETEGFHRRLILMGMMMAFYWTGGHEFFRRASQVYPHQRNTKGLRLWPFFKAVWLVLLKDMDSGRALRQAYRLGRYGRQNFWQVCFFLDLHLPFTRGRLLAGYDRYIATAVANPVVDLLATFAVLTWYLLILGPLFLVWEKLAGHQSRETDGCRQ